jgi:hypothetical protein
MATYKGVLKDNSTFTEFTIFPPFSRTFQFGTDASVTVTVTPNSGYEITEAKIFYGGMEETSMNIQSDNSWTYEITEADLSSMVHSGDRYIVDIYIDGQAIPTPPPRKDFFTIYKPTSQNMDTIDNAIVVDWSSATAQDIMKYFISYKRFRCNVPTDGDTNLKAGPVDFNELAPYTTSKTFDIDCGTIEVPELSHTLVDYSPYTQVRMFMPFCGFEYLDVEKVMGHHLHLVYSVDVITGKCLAKIYIDITTPESCYYQFAGTIATDEPFSQGDDYKGFGEAISITVLGDLQPYLVISTAKTLEGNLAAYEGYPTAEVIPLYQLDGFVKYDSVIMSGIPSYCTKRELNEIEELLKSGGIATLQTNSNGGNGNDNS